MKRRTLLKRLLALLVAPWGWLRPAPVKFFSAHSMGAVRMNEDAIVRIDMPDHWMVLSPGPIYGRSMAEAGAAILDRDMESAREISAHQTQLLLTSESTLYIGPDGRPHHVG